MIAILKLWSFWFQIFKDIEIFKQVSFIKSKIGSFTAQLEKQRCGIKYILELALGVISKIFASCDKETKLTIDKGERDTTEDFITIVCRFCHDSESCPIPVNCPKAISRHIYAKVKFKNEIIFYVKRWRVWYTDIQWTPVTTYPLETKKLISNQYRLTEVFLKDPQDFGTYTFSRFY